MIRIKYIYKSIIILLNYKLRDNFSNSKIIFKNIFNFKNRKRKVNNNIEESSFKKLNNWSQDNNFKCEFENILVD